MLPLGASANHSEGKGPKQDLVAGHGIDLPGIQAHVNAQSDPDGQGARGHAFTRFLGAEVVVDITCLKVNGNIARAGGVVTRSNVIPEGFWWVVRIIDNGEPGSFSAGSTNPDKQVFNSSAPNPNPTLFPTLCDLLFPVDFPPHGHLMEGNFIVHDATG